MDEQPKPASASHQQGHLTKREMICRISDETGMIQTDVKDVVLRFFDVLAEAISRGETIEIRNFGIFKTRHTKGKIGRNPKNPTQVIPIPPRIVVRFVAGKELKEKIRLLHTELPQDQPKESLHASTETIQMGNTP
ncbi:MAG: integration host factor subunit beta [Verrucomicrobiae bacterium]|nr:integration host factor subunit beta [Verrucomicrobiae bacterium]